jgi:hypothetical protein
MEVGRLVSTCFHRFSILFHFFSISPFLPAIFRVLSGMWPLVDGKVIKPPRSRVFYIPQRPLMVPGTFRDQITYPLCVKGPQEDEKLVELLSIVDLNYLLEKYGGWGSMCNWVDVLSNGEKQRLAMVSPPDTLFSPSPPAPYFLYSFPFTFLTGTFVFPPTYVWNSRRVCDIGKRRY